MAKSNFYISKNNTETDIYSIACIADVNKSQGLDFDCKFFNHKKSANTSDVSNAFDLTLDNGKTLYTSNKMFVSVPTNVSSGLKSKFGNIMLNDITNGKLFRGNTVCTVLGKPQDSAGNFYPGNIIPLDRQKKDLLNSNVWEMQYNGYFPIGIKRVDGEYTFADIVNKWESCAFNILAVGGGGAGGKGFEGLVTKWGGGGGGSGAAGSLFIRVKKADPNRRFVMNPGVGGSSDGGVFWFGGQDSGSNTDIYYYSKDSDGKDVSEWAISFHCGGTGGGDSAGGHSGGAGGTVTYYKKSDNNWHDASAGQEFEDNYVYIKVISIVNGVAGRGNRSSYGNRDYSGTLNKWNFLNTDYSFSKQHGDWKDKATYGGPGAASAFGNGGSVKSGNGEAGQGYGAGGAGGKGNGGHAGGAGGEGLIRILC